MVTSTVVFAVDRNALSLHADKGKLAEHRRGGHSAYIAVRIRTGADIGTFDDANRSACDRLAVG